MKATEVLREEHAAIKAMLGVVERMCARLENKAEIPAEHIGNILEFLKTFADKCHHHKEEEILFPEMERAGIPRDGGPIGVMLQEHEMGREYIRNLSQALERYQADRGEVAGIVTNARAYASLLSQHIYKEDNILYPMAERLLPGGRLEAMTKDFERVEKDMIGAEKHEEFHRLLAQLSTLYP